MICQICQHECKDAQGLGLHLIKTHKVKAKDYYDKYIKSLGEGVCSNCQDETLFLSLGRGYSKYCSQECMLNGFEEDKRNKFEEQQDKICQGVECKICGVKYESAKPRRSSSSYS
jgi:hypothetical protein